LMEVLPLRTIRNRKGYHWFVVGTVCVGAFMAALDASVINIALPTLRRHFHTSMYIVVWVSLAYLLTLAGLIIPFGRLADMFGRRWMYSLGFSVFIFGSLLCGISPNLPLLLTARIVQAIGAAMLQANSVSIITAATPANARGRAIGIQASAQGIGLSIGPAVGGALITFLNWRWIFFVNLPIGLIGTVLGILLLPRDQKATVREHFDFAGALWFIPAVVSLIYFMNVGLTSGWLSKYVVASYCLFMVGAWFFVRVERNSPCPMVDLSLFRNRAFSIGGLTGVLSFAVMYAVLYLCPFYFDNVLHIDPFLSGLYLTLIPIGMTILTPISGLIADRLGARSPTILGMVASTLGCLLLCFIRAEVDIPVVLVGLLLVGIGLGMFTPPNNSSVMNSAPLNRLGVAGGILNMARTLGMGLGVTLGGFCYQLFSGSSGAGAENVASVGQMVDAFRWSFVVAGCLAAFTVILSTVGHPRSNAVS
jgi:EmrB/QacA subfamily drug resistance transporter